MLGKTRPVHMLGKTRPTHMLSKTRATHMLGKSGPEHLLSKTRPTHILSSSAVKITVETSRSAVCAVVTIVCVGPGPVVGGHTDRPPVSAHWTDSISAACRGKERPL